MRLFVLYLFLARFKHHSFEHCLQFEVNDGIPKLNDTEIRKKRPNQDCAIIPKHDLPRHKPMFD